METMVTRDGGYPLPSQINIHEWKQWLQGMGSTLYRQKLIFINGNNGYKGWGVPPSVTN